MSEYKNVFHICGSYDRIEIILSAEMNQHVYTSDIGDGFTEIISRFEADR
jgi:hypothetical protein